MSKILYPCLIIFLFLTQTTFAGIETGAILGSVNDMNGEPVPGVAITASNQSMIGWNSLTHTGEDGYYRFPALPPGIYEIKIELAGFQTIVRKDVRLFVGNSLTVDFTLSLQPVSETIEVSGNSPALDVTTPATPAIVQQEFIEKLPKSTGSASLFILTPGIDEQEGVAYGAGGPQASAYWFDGVDVSDPVLGTGWQIPNYNWIQEVQVIGLGAPAEYGGFTGVISNSITRSGGNQFHGLFETFFQNDSFTSENLDSAHDYLTPPSVDLFTDSSIQIGGPILYDKLWFFSGFEYLHVRDAPLGYPPSGEKAFRTHEEPKFISKITYRLNQDNHFQGFLEYEDYNTRGLGASPSTLPEATGIENSPGWFWNLTWTSLLSTNTLLDIRTSGFQSKFDNLPLNGNIPGHYEFTTGIFSVNQKSTFQSDRGRTQANVSLSHFARDFLKGNHDFKFGVQYEHSNAHQIDSFNGGVFYYDYFGYTVQRNLWSGSDFDTNLNQVSTFAQDDWNFTNQLTLSLGLRWDYSNVNQAAINMITHPIAPRIGFIYDIKGDQKTVIKAHYGHYYESAITTFVDKTGPTGVLRWDYFDFENQEWVPYGTYVFQEIIDKNIKCPYTQQFTAGIDQQLTGDLIFGAHYIHRRYKDSIQDVETLAIYEPFEWKNPLTGEPMTLYKRLNPNENLLMFTNPPEAYRQYDGIQFTGSKRFSKNFNLTGSFVISKSKGNLDNTFDESRGFNRPFDSPNSNINFDGNLTNDVTFEFKLLGYYDFPWGISSSWFFRHYSGDTWSPTYAVDDLVQEGFMNVFLLPRGSNRLHSRNILDLRAEKSFPVFNGDFKFTVDILNVFNTGYVLQLQQILNRPGYGEPIDFSAPRQVRMGIRYQF